MFNVKQSRKGNILTLEIDLSKVSHVTEPRLNKFGKMYPGSEVIATTNGNVDIGGMRLGLNVFRPRKAETAAADDTVVIWGNIPKLNRLQGVKEKVKS